MKSTITHVGKMALEFVEDNVVVFFGPKAPKELRDISIIHESIEGSFDASSLISGGELLIGDDTYEIVRVGEDAVKNIEELGHISIYFSSPPKEILPGAVYVKPQRWPTIQVGSTFEIR